MGGGACTWAMRQHVEAGLTVYATPEAARSFSDDPEKVAAWGVKLVSAAESARVTGRVIRMRDIALDSLEKVLLAYGISFVPDALAVCALDHGAAPKGVSERLFRFRHLESLLKKKDTLETFIYEPKELPDFLTRMQAVVRTIGGRFPLVVMDTGPAAVYGALLDPQVAARPDRVCANLGNSHTLAFHLDGERVLGLFEHHTENVPLPHLEDLMEKLVSGELTNEQVWNEGGHGALVRERRGNEPLFAVTGPRRSYFGASRLKPYLAAPFGSMMLAGCFGLARASAIKFPQWREEIETALLKSA
jgi:uncharacterized protein (DUF1786 family)